jgi:hypothetical protein
MRSDGCFDSADPTNVRRREPGRILGPAKSLEEVVCMLETRTTAGVDMRVALPYCLLKVPLKSVDPSSPLPSISDPSRYRLDASGDGFEM